MMVPQSTLVKNVAFSSIQIRPYPEVEILNSLSRKKYLFGSNFIEVVHLFLW